jgi:hypothetical protein
MNKTALIRERFIHRTDVFAHQWYSTEKQEGGYVKVTHGECSHTPKCPKRRCPDVQHVPMTSQDVQRHLEGDITLGIYPMDEEGTVKWLCFDVDIDKGVDVGEAQGKIRAHTIALARVLKAWDIPFLVEYSGSRGYHIWIFFEPVQALKVYAFGRFFERQVEPPEGIHVEVFPKQATQKTYGSLIKLPLGKHRKTGNWCGFVDRHFELLSGPDQWEALELFPVVTEKQLDGLILDCQIDVEAFRSQVNIVDQPGAVGAMTPPCMVNVMTRGVVEGARDVPAFRLSCYFRDRGFPMDMAVAAMEEWNSRNDPPMDADVLLTKVESAYSGAYSFFPCQEPVFDSYCDSSCRYYAEKMRKRRARYKRKG